MENDKLAKLIRMESSRKIRKSGGDTCLIFGILNFILNISLAFFIVSLDIRMITLSKIFLISGTGIYFICLIFSLNLWTKARKIKRKIEMDYGILKELEEI